MADFSKYTNYDKHAGVSSVVFGSKSSVIEVEMNEMQEVQKTMLRSAIYNLMGDGITDLSKITYADGVLQVADQCAFSVGGYLVECTGLSVEMTSGTAYLQVWEETVAYTAELKKDGNQQSTETVSNYFKDARTPAETTRRKVVKYTLATSQKSDAENLAIASVTSGKMEKLCREVNMAKLTDKVIDLQVQIGTLGEGVLGVEVDLENNTVKRLGESETWSAGDDFNQSPIYGERKRCNMTADGKIVAFYGDEAYTETGALTTAVTGSDGTTYAIGTAVDAMVIQPAYYYKRIPLKVVKQTDSTYSVKGYHMMKWIDLISPTFKDGYKLHPAFKMGAESNSYYLIGENEGCIANGTTIDKTDTASLDASATMRSIAGAKPSSGSTKNGNKELTRAAVRTACAKDGNIQHDFTIASSEQMLFLIEYATFNAQALTDVFGKGITNLPSVSDVNDSVPSPTNTTLGNGSGKIEVSYTHSNGTAYTLYVPVYRGVKNFFGNIWEFIDAFMRKHSAAADCNEAYWQDGSKAFSDNIADYKPCGFSCATHEGYIKAFGYSEDCDFAYMTSLTGGDSSNPVGDYYYMNMTNNNYIALLGADWVDGLAAGLFCWYLSNVASARYYDIGGRKCRKKAVTIVAPSANAA